MMRSGLWVAGLCAIALVTSLAAQEPPAQFGGEYAGLDARRQQLVADWVGRYNEVTGQNVGRRPILRSASQDVGQDDVRRGDQRADAYPV